MYLTRRQKQILDYVRRYLERHGFAPTIEEIGDHFGLSSVATVHKHLTSLQAKGLLRREANRSRALEIVPPSTFARAVELPLLGFVAAGVPIEAIETADTLAVPEELVRHPDTYVLQVRGDSMIDEQIRDGDYVIVENRPDALDGEMVIALVRGDSATLKKLYREAGGRIRLQPANPHMRPLVLDATDVRVQGVVVGILRKY
jgi:repressor LexA